MGGCLLGLSFSAGQGLAEMIPEAPDCCYQIPGRTKKAKHLSRERNVLMWAGPKDCLGL